MWGAPTHFGWYFLKYSLSFSFARKFGKIQRVLAMNIIPATLGNIIGGSLFVATVNWYIYLHDVVVPTAVKV